MQSLRKFNSSDDQHTTLCPRCHTHHINRIFPRWSRLKGLEMFECILCGKKFYKRGVDDYRPTFENRW